MQKGRKIIQTEITRKYIVNICKQELMIKITLMKNFKFCLHSDNTLKWKKKNHNQQQQQKNRNQYY